MDGHQNVNNNNIPITAPTPSLLEEDGAIVGSIEVPGTLLAAGAEATSSMPFQMGAQLPDYFPSAPYALPLLTNQLDGPGNEPPMPPLGLPYNLVDPAQQAFELFQQEINNRTAAAETMAVGMGEPEKEDIAQDLNFDNGGDDPDYDDDEAKLVPKTKKRKKKVDSSKPRAAQKHFSHDGKAISLGRTKAGKLAKTTNVARRVEQCDPTSFAVLQTHASCSDAARVTGINRTRLSRLCRKGGGLLKDGKSQLQFYRYAGDQTKSIATTATTSSEARPIRTAEAETKTETRAENGDNMSSVKAENKTVRVSLSPGETFLASLGSVPSHIPTRTRAQRETAAVASALVRMAG